MSCVCPYVGVGVVSWRGGASRCPCGATSGASTPCLRGYTGVWAVLCRGHVSSASGVGGARLRHRAPGAGIPTGAATGGSRAVGSVDAMLHDMRRRCNGSRLQVDRWAMRWCEDSTCGWLDNGNSAGDDTRARCRGNWGKTTTTGGPHLSTTTAW
jgi:hypothetical protein